METHSEPVPSRGGHGISEVRSKLSYVTVQDADKAVLSFEQGAILAKVDKSAY